MANIDYLVLPLYYEFQHFLSTVGMASNMEYSPDEFLEMLVQAKMGLNPARDAEEVVQWAVSAHAIADRDLVLKAAQNLSSHIDRFLETFSYLRSNGRFPYIVIDNHDGLMQLKHIEASS